MKITGIIAEFNPFHNGHEYLIKKARATTEADYLIVAMSGDYVQRGEPAVFPKHLRAQMALSAGADLVVELPVEASTASAEFFASAGVSLLSNLGMTHLCFGCESILDPKLNDLLIKVLCEEPSDYQILLRQELKNGHAFPKARQSALIQYFGDEYKEKLSHFLNQPNNILGIEYQKAIFRLNNHCNHISTIPILRIGSNYHDIELPDHNKSSVEQLFPSATALRESLYQRQGTLTSLVPDDTYKIIANFEKEKGPVFSEDCSLLLQIKLMNLTIEQLCDFLDVTEDLAYKIKNNLDSYLNFKQYCQLLKSADLTYTRITRVLLHILLDIKKNCLPISTSYGYVLGFRKGSTQLLSYIKKEKDFPLITKINDHTLKHMDEQSKKQIYNMISASNLYEAIITNKYQTTFIHEKTKETVRL